MQTDKSRLTFIVIVSQMMMTACTTTAPSSNAGGLTNTVWVLATLHGQASPGGRPVTLHFEDDRIHGTDGCNRYSGTYAAKGEELHIDGNIVATRMACPEPFMQQADAFVRVLTQASTFRRNARQLLLLDAGGADLASFRAQPSDLGGTAWQVTSYDNGRQAVVSVLGGSRLSAHFASDGRLGGSAGCNNYDASYTLSGQNMSIGQATAARTTCNAPDGVMEQEERFLQALGSVFTWRLDGDRLHLLAADGALALSLSAVSSAARSMTHDPAANTRLFLLCGDRRTLIANQGEGMRLTVDGETFTMRQAVSASGARYVAVDDAATSFWSKGERGTLVVRGRTYPDCAPAPSLLLQGGEWVVEDLNRAGIIDNSRATFQFDTDGRLAGRSFCNMYAGEYRLAGEQLAVSVAATSRQACAPALMQQERVFFEALNAVRGFSFSHDGALILHTGDHRTILARRPQEFVPSMRSQMKLMHSRLRQGATHSHSRSYGKDLQRRMAREGAISCNWFDGTNYQSAGPVKAAGR